MKNKWSKVFWSDLAERVGATFIAALLGMVTLAGTTPVDWGDANALWAVLGIPTVVALLKGLLANLADPESGASLLPSPPGPDVVKPQLEEGGYANLVMLIVLAVVAAFTIWLLWFVSR